MTEANERAALAAREFVTRVARSWSDRLGPRLLGVYFIGSLAHGGFSARYSDIDVAAIVTDPLAPAELDAMREAARAQSIELAARLSIFWADRTFTVGRFPPLDRIDLIDHAVPVIERRRVRPARPSLDDIRHYLGGQPFAAWTEQVRHFANAAALDGADHKPYVRALLYPARLLYSWETGAMASNDAAVAFLARTPVAGLDLDLVGRTLACRRAGRDPDELFAERAKLLRQHEACAAATGASPQGART
jgi:predicted nucleotidyltransferase